MAEIDAIGCSPNTYGLIDEASEQFTICNSGRIPHILNQSLAQNISRTDESIRKTRVAARVSGEADVGIDIKWGGEKGVEIGGHAKGEVRDDNGNYGRIEITQNSDGSGGASISGGHKED